MRPVRLPDGRRFGIDPAVAAAFPEARVGVLVADVRVARPAADMAAELQATLAERGVKKEGLAEFPAIKVWREAYRMFGVKPSDYRSSVEALVRRVLDGKPAQVNSVVDLYNAVSVRQLLPMGAMDLDHVHGDITLRFGRSGETAELLGMEAPVFVTDRQVVYADEKRVITWLWNHRDARDTAVTLETQRAIFFVDGLQGSESVATALEELAERLGGQPGCAVLWRGCV